MKKIWLVCIMVGALSSTVNLISVGKKEKVKKQVKKIDRKFVLGQEQTEAILIQPDFFKMISPDGTTIVEASVHQLLKILKEIANKYEKERKKIEEETREKAIKERNEIIAQKMRDLFKPLQEHIISQYIAQNQQSKVCQEGALGWQAHLMTATLASAITLVAVYGAIKTSSLRG